MRQKVRNRLEMLRAPVTQRLADPSAEVCAWIWVLQLPDGRIRVARIIVPRVIVESGYWFGEEGYETAELRLVEGIDEVDEAVRHVGGDSEELESPWINEFPL